jgi:1,4-alpha-glucan branching enzyme
VTISPFKLVSAVAACVLIIALVFQLSTKRFETAIRRTGPQLVPVTLSLANNEARSVYLIGSFNDWKPEGYEMKLDRRSNRWVLEISLPPGQHEYAFLINDKQAISDPQATFYKMDGFGSRNSVIYLSSGDESVL